MTIYESKYTRTQIDEGIGAGYVPTLNSAPTTSTLTYTRSDLPSGSQTVSFVVGQMCRVAVTGGYDFYQLKDVTSGTATWVKTGDLASIDKDGTSSTKYLRGDGTWQAFPTIPTVPTFSSLTLSGTAQAYDGTHTLKVQDGTSSQKGIVQLGTTSSTAALGNHAHGNLTNAGALQTTDISIASGDKLVVTDSSNSSKVARTSITFDGSTATKALTQKGTWETFLTSHQDMSGKEDKMTVVIPGSVTSLSPAINTLSYMNNVNTLAVTLPEISDTTKVQTLVLRLNMGTNPNLSFTAQSGYIEYAADFEIEAEKGYEISCMRFSSYWDIVAHEVDYYRGQ